MDHVFNRFEEELIMKKHFKLTAVFYLALILAVMSFLLSACSPGDGEEDGGSLPGSGLENTFWTMTSMAGSEPLPGAEITAGFINGQMSGSTGCNNYFAGYETQGDRLILTNGAVTEMFCMQPEGVMEIEKQFMDYFYQVDRFHLTADELQLITSAGESLIFVPRTQ
jgi:heat shock protein HslJ